MRFHPYLVSKKFWFTTLEDHWHSYVLCKIKDQMLLLTHRNAIHFLYLFLYIPILCLLKFWILYEFFQVATFLTLGGIAILLFIIGMFPHVGNFSHIGGFMFGIFFGYVFFRKGHWDWSHYQSGTSNHRTHNTSDMGLKMCKTLIWAVVVIFLVIM